MRRGATLLEILISLVIIGLVAAGIMTAFVFGRRLGWRSGTELDAATLLTDVSEALRGAIHGPLPNGLNLNPGIYVDEKMQNPPAGAVRLAALNFPAEFLRFQRFIGTDGSLGSGADGRTGHGDGRMLIVERADENGNGIADEDLDRDGLIGSDFNGDRITDLRRVRVRVTWSSPES